MIAAAQSRFQNHKRGTLPPLIGPLSGFLTKLALSQRLLLPN